MPQFGLVIFFNAKNVQNLLEIGWPVRLFISMSDVFAIYDDNILSRLIMIIIKIIILYFIQIRHTDDFP